MSVKPKTIDNLGVEASIRYAQNQRDLDFSLLQDTLLTKGMEVSRLVPALSPEIDRLLSPSQPLPWALFSPPPNGLTLPSPLFSYKLVPGLWGDEEEDEDEEEEGDEEEDTLQEMLACLEKLDTLLEMVNGRRNQFQRG